MSKRAQPSDDAEICPLAALAFGVLVIALINLPERFVASEAVASAAAEEGFDGPLAAKVVFVWMGAVMAIAAVTLGRRERLREIGAEAPPPPRRNRSRLEPTLAFCFGLLAYFPPFLAPRGPYIEDKIHLGLLARMHEGQVPYRDFEFLYGPLMLAPAELWTRIFGLSMHSFYGWVALLEGLTLALLAFTLQRLLPDGRRRLLAWVLLLPFAFNSLVGPNQNALRRLFPVFLLLALAADPARRRRRILVGLGAGLGLAWSHDFGVAAIAALVATIALDGGLARGLRLRAVLEIGGTALVTWFLVGLALLREAFPDYLRCAAFLVGRMTAGEAGFRFYWTLNSLALLALGTLTLAVVGRGIGRYRLGPNRPADRVFLGCHVLVLVGLRSAFNRCDFWHLDAPFLGLLLILRLGRMDGSFRIGGGLARTLLILTALVAASAGLGNLPSSTHLLRGWVRGARDVLDGRRPPETPTTQAFSVLKEQTEPAPDFLALAAWLDAPERLGRPVYFHGDTWSYGLMVGVTKIDYLNDDFLYSESRGDDLRDRLLARPDWLVLIKRDAADRLYRRAPLDRFPELDRQNASGMLARASEWISSVHLRGLRAEWQARERRLDRAVGALLRDRYREVAAFGRLLVLDRR